MRFHKLTIALLAIACVTASCGKDQEATDQFPRSGDLEPRKRVVSELKSFTLANGATIFLQEERSNDQVAVEVFFRAGYMQEPSGKTHIAHLAEHAVLFAGTKSYEPEAAADAVRRYGMMNAQAAPDFVHYDYIVPSDKLEEVLRIEAERMTSMQFSEEITERETEKAATEIDNSASSGRSIAGFAVAALNQIVHHGRTNIELPGSIRKLTVNDLQFFHDTFYRPDNMVIAIIGAISMDEVETLVRSYFEPLASKPAPAKPRSVLNADVSATWDIPVDAGFLVFDGNYESYRERLILMIYGAYLSRELVNAASLGTVAQSTNVSNLNYRLDWGPFYIYIQPRGPQLYELLRDGVFTELEVARKKLNEEQISLLKTNAVAFLTSTMLKEDVPPPSNVPHYREIGQEAVNVGIRHYFCDGQTIDEVVEIINSLTPEEITSVIDEYITRENAKELRLTPRLAPR